MDRANASTKHDLLEFASVQAHPARIGEDTGSSAHEIILTVATRLLKEPWSTEELKAYFQKYSLGEPGHMDWEAVKAAGDTTFHGVERFECLRDDEFGPLLRIEYAKAQKLLTSPGTKAPLLLGNVESTVLEALGDKSMRRKELAKECGFASSYLGDRLPRMVERGLLEKGPEGYRRAGNLNF